MESQTYRTSPDQRHLTYNLIEILCVFLPAFTIVELTSSWVGENPTRSFIIVWAVNLLMLGLIWGSLKLRSQQLKDLGVSFGPVRIKEVLRVFSLSLLVFVLGTVAFLLGPVITTIFTEAPQNADFTRYEFLKDNLSGLFLSLTGVYFISSFGEEFIYRAFLINRINDITGPSKYASIMAVLISAALFGVIHYEWGLMGMIQTTCMGLVMGIFYIKLKKSFWILVLAHMYMDTLLFVQIYLASN
ncbi:MAG: CPBP family intramembrane metalloprotease [Cyclobacteriaceae bacterium]